MPRDCQRLQPEKDYQNTQLMMSVCRLGSRTAKMMLRQDTLEKEPQARAADRPPPSLPSPPPKKIKILYFRAIRKFLKDQIGLDYDIHIVQEAATHKPILIFKCDVIFHDK
jgi:hypothetical protein